MSYCRFFDGDVYVFMHVSGHLECCGCVLNVPDEPWDLFKAESTQEMVDHLELHVAKGHRVPSHVVPNLWADDAENFPL